MTSDLHWPSSKSSVQVTLRCRHARLVGDRGRLPLGGEPSIGLVHCGLTWVATEKSHRVTSLSAEPQNALNDESSHRGQLCDAGERGEASPF